MSYYDSFVAPFIEAARSVHLATGCKVRAVLEIEADIFDIIEAEQLARGTPPRFGHDRMLEIHSHVTLKRKGKAMTGYSFAADGLEPT